MATYLPNIPKQLSGQLDNLIQSMGLAKALESSFWARDSSSLAHTFGCCNQDHEDGKTESLAITEAVEAIRRALEPFVPAIQNYWDSCKDWDADSQSYLESDPSLLPSGFSANKESSPVVVMNEQHTLLPEQADLLPNGYTIASVPAQGWDLDTIRQKSDKWGDRMVILLSPIPALMSIRAKEGLKFQVFHNDQREKKELPDGRIIHTVAKNGWQLV